MSKKKNLIYKLIFTIGLITCCFNNSIIGYATPTSDVTISFEESIESDIPSQEKPNKQNTSPFQGQKNKTKLPQLNDLLTSMILILLGIALLILAISIVVLKKIVVLQERSF